MPTYEEGFDQTEQAVPIQNDADAVLCRMGYDTPSCHGRMTEQKNAESPSHEVQTNGEF